MIAVLTCPRRDGVSYLEGTVASIDASARSMRKVVFVDGDVAPEVPSAWTTVFAARKTERPENRWTAWAAMSLAASLDEDLILLEDDVRFCQHGVAFAERLTVPEDVAFVSLFAPFGDLTMHGALWRAPMSAYLYAQALKFPLRTLRTLVEARREMEDARTIATDGVLREIGERRGWHYATVYPGIAQHVGATSAFGTAGLTGCRVSRAYAGDAFDANSLSWQLYR